MFVDAPVRSSKRGQQHFAVVLYFGHARLLREVVRLLQQVDRPLAIAGAVSAEEHVSVIEARERERRAVTHRLVQIECVLEMMLSLVEPLEDHRELAETASECAH